VVVVVVRRTSLAPNLVANKTIRRDGVLDERSPIACFACSTYGVDFIRFGLCERSEGIRPQQRRSSRFTAAAVATTATAGILLIHRGGACARGVGARSIPSWRCLRCDFVGGTGKSECV